MSGFVPAAHMHTSVLRALIGITVTCPPRCPAGRAAANNISALHGSSISALHSSAAACHHTAVHPVMCDDATTCDHAPD